MNGGDQLQVSDTFDVYTRCITVINAILLIVIYIQAEKLSNSGR